MENLSLSWHEESWVSTNLTELRVTEGVLNDTVDETQSNRMILHLGVVEIVEEESRAFLDDDGVVSTIER